MDKQIKKEWLKALRSGDYQQGSDYLNVKNTTFCCLGVICELAFKQGIVRKEAAGDTIKYISVKDLNDGDQWVLPNAVVVWAGLKESNPEINNENLAEFNDTGASFEEIADVIEKEL